MPVEKLALFGFIESGSFLVGNYGNSSPVLSILSIISPI